MGTVLVVAEIQNGAIREASYELVAAAQGIDGAEVNGLVIGSGVGDLAGEFASKGAGKTYVVDDAAAENYNVDVWSKAIKAAAEASGADLILISNTPTGWDVAPPTGADVVAGCAAVLLACGRSDSGGARPALAGEQPGSPGADPGGGGRVAGVLARRSQRDGVPGLAPLRAPRRCHPQHPDRRHRPRAGRRLWAYARGRGR